VSRPYAYRGPDGEIDLEEALGPHLRHYVGIMVAGANGTRTQVLAEGGSATAHGFLVRQAFGRPTRASSRGTVAVSPEWSWDVCGYYVTLGVRWTATKREIRLAYVAACARDDGQEQDEYLTYVVAQLSDPGVRRAYDLTPLGGVFLLDKYIAMRIKKAAAAEASRRMAQGEEAATTDEVLEEMGLHEEKPPADAGDAPDRPPESLWGLQWGHYVLSGPQGPPRPDTALLEAWQGLVAAALRERGIVTEFAVAQGNIGSPSVLRDSKEPCIFILTETEASPEKAREAVELGIDLGIVTYNSGRPLHGDHAKGRAQGRGNRGRAEVSRLLPR
jgi:hypothetical protein